MISRRSLTIINRHIARNVAGSRAQSLVQSQHMFKSSNVNNQSSDPIIDKEYGRLDSRPDRIEVDPEKENRFNQGPKSQAECPTGGMNRHGTRANQHITAEGRGMDSQNPYKEPENLDLGDTYGRDYEVEKDNTEGGPETRFVRPDYRLDRMEMEEGKKSMKTAQGYSKKVGTGRSSATGDEDAF